ncbi:hypothetical protein [Capnocytophaga felis]|nr:hypothetical protein [Capnocytophaga felis]
MNRSHTHNISNPSEKLLHFFRGLRTMKEKNQDSIKSKEYKEFKKI